jgi:protein TonB
MLGNPAAPPPPSGNPNTTPAEAIPAGIPKSAPATQPRPGSGRFEPAKLVSGSTPSVPSMARQLGVHGTVTLELTVDQRGAVKSVQVMNGHKMLATAAEEAVWKWRYQPAKLNGQTIESKIDVRMVFEEKGK